MKKIICLILSVIALLTATLSAGSVAYANDPIKTKNISFADFKTLNDIVGKDGYQCNFTLDSDSAVCAEFDLSLSAKKIGGSYAKKLDGTNGVKFYIISLDGDKQKIVWSTNVMLSKNKLAESRQFCPGKILEAGNYAAFAVPCKNDYVAKVLKCKFRLYSYAGFAEEAKFPAAATLNAGAVKKLALTELAPVGRVAAASWATSDSAVAKITKRDKDFAEITGVKAGSCVITATLKNGTKYTCKVTVKNPAPKISEKEITLPKTTAKTLKILYTTKKVKWESTDKKVATVSKKGKVTAKGTGNCKITAKCGGKKYTCKVKVVKAKPDFAASLVEYNKKGNYFVVKFCNYGAKSLTVVSKGAACISDKDSLNRHLHLKGNKNIVIKPGKAKTVKYYVKGKKTSTKISRFGIMYSFRYGGEKYTAGVWCEDSTYKLGKKWKPTYTYECDMYRIQGLEYSV